MEIISASPADIELLAPLFDAYRVFYEAPSDLEGARRFLTGRLSLGQSRLFYVREDGPQGPKAIGFTQLYPSFSSVSMKRMWILNDLYVAPAARMSGVGAALMAHAEAFARADGAKGLSLATQIGNTTAQALYAKMGYFRDEQFLHYHRYF